MEFASPQKIRYIVLVLGISLESKQSFFIALQSRKRYIGQIARVAGEETTTQSPQLDIVAALLKSLQVLIRVLDTKERKTMNSRIVLSGFLWLASATLPAGLHAQTSTDNPSVTAQLDAAKPIIAKIKKDAAELQSFSSASGPSWASHAAVLTRIKDDVNKLQESTRGLQSHRSVASAWQQDAIDRVTSLANDLATNMNKVMDHLNKNKTRPTAPPYPEYLKANTQIVNALAEEIDSTIDYGENKAKMGELEKKLPE